MIIGPMTSAVDLAEFERLRQESDSRALINSGLLAVELTALGGGLAAFNRFPDVVYALAVVSSFLWLQWLDNAGHCYKIGAYIALRLAPRLRRSAPGALAWEEFLREVHRGDAWRALGLTAAPKWRFPSRWPTVSDYAAIVFGGTPLALLSIGLVKIVSEPCSANRIIRVAASVAALAGWGIAFGHFRQFKRLNRMIDNAIGEATQHTTRPPAGPRPDPPTAVSR
jgi:hypothetical protein